MASNATILNELKATDPVGFDRYFTKAPLAERIAVWAGVDTCNNFLEPSAGGGAFVDAILKTRGPSTQNQSLVMNYNITVVELDTVLAARLTRRYAEKKQFVNVMQGDFLKFKQRPGTEQTRAFDLALMNPPYGSRMRGSTVGLSAIHVRHALRFTKRVVALVTTGFEQGSTHQTELFDDCYVSRRVVLVNRPGFEGPDDKGESPRRPHVVLELKEKTEHMVISTINVPTERWILDAEGNQL